MREMQPQGWRLAAEAFRAHVVPRMRYTGGRGKINKPRHTIAMDASAGWCDRRPRLRRIGAGRRGGRKTPNEMYTAIV